MSDLVRYVTTLPPEQEAIRAKCFHPTGHFEEFAKEEVEQSVPERFEKIVKRHADRIAIKERDRAVTYAELNERADRIADAILDRCGEGNEPVAILMEHGASVLVTIIAVLKAGKIYVPLDPSYPVERIRYMLRDAQAKLIVTHRATLALARQMSGGESCFHRCGRGHGTISTGCCKRENSSRSLRIDLLHFGLDGTTQRSGG